MATSCLRNLTLVSASGANRTDRRSQHDETLVDVFALGLDVLVFLEIKLKLLQFACPPRGIVLQ
jgi:hypothetical protein